VDDVRHRRATSFGDVADAYVRGRPGYPPEAIEWVLADAPGPRVIDLAAGTGKLTASLVAMGLDVTAIEPLEAMRQALAEVVPNVTVLAGTAESMPVGDGSADGMLVAQAFHWFDPLPALTEMARVLVPEAPLGLIWNARDDSHPWVAELSQILAAPVDVVSRWDWSDGRPLTDHPDFRDSAHRRFPNDELYTPQRLVEWAESTSTIAILDPPERRQRLAQVTELCRTHPDLRGRSSFPLPMVTMTIRATRR
jgi:SAM-dependent methyltransferase